MASAHTVKTFPLYKSWCPLHLPNPYILSYSEIVQHIMGNLMESAPGNNGFPFNNVSKI
ncbi:hypothetical protein Fmac_008653 [Flemingia macrophylla]|uniref:Uncharacterized protein n=1 Tax=Flemingia macrophylla TaxID=520843 RepID=A0ABD1MZ71_9FABA